MDRRDEIAYSGCIGCIRTRQLMHDASQRLTDLEAENIRLRRQLATVSVSRGHSNGTVGYDSKASTPSLHGAAAISPEHAQGVTYEELVKRYRLLQEEHKLCAKYIQLANRRYQAAKENARQWKLYLDSKRLSHFAEGSRPANPGNPKCSSIALQEEAVLYDGPAADPHAIRQPPDPHEPGDVDVCVAPSAMDQANESLNHCGLAHRDAGQVAAELHDKQRTQPRRLRVTSSQTTEADSEEPVPELHVLAGTQPSSDSEPIVVSTRPVKRKRRGTVERMPPPRRVKQETDSPQRTIEIKSENSNDSMNCPSLLHMALSDLDILRGSYTTPRKRQRLVDAQDRAVSEEHGRPPQFVLRTSSLSEGDMLDNLHQAESVNRVVCETDRAKASRTARALRPLSPNIASGHSHVPRRTRLSREIGDEVAASKAALLSEDGASQGVVGKVVVSTVGLHDGPSRVIGKRLDQLLEAPVARRKPLDGILTPNTAKRRATALRTPSSESPPSQSRKQQESALQPHKATQPPVSQSTRNGSSNLHPNRQHAPSEDRLLSNQENKPLRLCPVEALKLSDFKINPDYLGANFAFTNTGLRGREQRKCLQVCTRPDCCGALFLEEAKAGGAADLKMADDEVLEQYLGPTWADIVSACPPEKKEQMLLEAKAYALARKYGKHRNAFERRSTPPGFWRTEMPDTQERAEDREEAERMTRAKVEERWREALRGGGRWMFRDEL